MLRTITVTIPLDDAVKAVFALQEMCEEERKTATVSRTNGNGDLANHIERNIARVQVLINAISAVAIAQ